MAELKKVKNEIMENFYEGNNGSRRVICILDAYCVRYMVFENGKFKGKHEFPNGKEALCFRNASKALNK